MLFRSLNIDNKDQEELFKILESNNSFDSLEDDFSPSSRSCYQSTDDFSDSPNIKSGCRDSCCNVINSVNTLTKGEENEELIIQLINQIQNPELQKEYLDKFKKNLLKDEIGKKLKSTISFKETLERFNKKKSKDLTVNDLQYEITIVKQEMIDLKNEFQKIILLLSTYIMYICIPKVPTNQIYRSSWSLKKAFKTDYHAKTIEQVYSLNKEYEMCYLLTPSALLACKKDGHNYLHIGLVQVGVKPLIREGLNCSVLMVLRDTSHIRS